MIYTAWILWYYIHLMFLENQWEPLIHWHRGVSVFFSGHNRSRYVELLLVFSSRSARFRMSLRWVQKQLARHWLRYADRINLHGSHCFTMCHCIILYQKLIYIWWVVDLPLWKIRKSVGIILPKIRKKRKCSKQPPTRCCISQHFIIFPTFTVKGPGPQRPGTSRCAPGRHPRAAAAASAHWCAPGDQVSALDVGMAMGIWGIKVRGQHWDITWCMGNWVIGVSSRARNWTFILLNTSVWDVDVKRFWYLYTHRNK